MAVAAFPEVQSSQAPSSKPATWSFKGLLKEIKDYLWRYGTVTDVDTDPIDLLAQAEKALSTQQETFEKREKQLDDENALLRTQLAAANAKLAKVPAWWKG